MDATVEFKPQRKNTVGIGAAFLSIFVMLIPVIGLLVSIVMSIAVKNKSLKSIALAMLIINLIACLIFVSLVLVAKWAFDLAFDKATTYINEKTDGLVPKFDSVPAFVEAVNEIANGDFTVLGGMDAIKKFITKYIALNVGKVITPEFVEQMGGAEAIGNMITKDVVDAVGGAEGVGQLLTKDVVENLGGASGVAEFFTPEVVEAVGGASGVAEVLTPAVVENLGGAQGVGELLTPAVVENLGGKEGVKEAITPDVSEMLGDAEDFSQYLTPDVLESLGGMEGLEEILSAYGY